MAMIQCDRCGSGLKEGTTKCHVCGSEVTNTAPAGPTGLTLGSPKPEGPQREVVAGIPGIDNQAAPLPNYLSGSTSGPIVGGTGEMRVSLTGEVFEAPPSTMRPASAPGVPATNAMGRPLPQAPQVARHAGSIPPRAMSEAPAKRGAPILAIVLVLLILGGGGAGGYWWWNKQQGPARAADKFLQAFQKKDWDGLINMIEMPAAANNPLGGMGKEMLKTTLALMGPMIEIKSYKIGKTTFEGEKAKVEVTVTAELKAGLNLAGATPGQNTKTDQLPLILVKDEWKLDATGASSGGLPGLGGGGGVTGATGGR